MDKCIINIGEFMKHEITSMNTKKALSASLKKLMEHKKISKITVTEIITDCGVNRKTFYYHFEDIYALLKWTLEQETTEILKNFDLLLNPKEAIMFVMDYVDKNVHILNCVYDSMSIHELRRFFHSDFYDVILSIIKGVENEHGISLPSDFERYMADFYTNALVGVLTDYFRHKEERNRNELIEHTLFMLKTSIPDIIDEYSRTAHIKSEENHF